MPLYTITPRALLQPTHLTLALSLLLSGTSAWAEKISKITFSNAGLAEVVRTVEIPKDAPVTLQVPLEQVNDVLKTLMVIDGKNRIQSLSLAGQAPLEQSFASLPFDAHALQSIASLAQHLRGAQAVVHSAGRSVKGVILGVETQALDQGQVRYVLSLLAEEGQIQSIELGPDSSLQVQDKQLQEKLRQATDILARQTNEGSRQVQIKLASPQSENLELAYLIAVPVWKTSYRLVLDQGKARLQAWAVLENTTGEDWDNVDITLSSGSPVVYQQSLLQQYWHDRPELPVAVGSSVAPEADRESVYRQSMADSSPVMAARAEYSANETARRAAKMASAGARSMAMETTAPPSPAAVGQESQTVVRFHLSDALSVASGQTVSVPFQDSELQADAVSVYRQGQDSPHPTAAIYLKNTLNNSLPAGIMTVFDAQEGHIGDAELAGLPLGQARLIYFAGDNKVQISEQQEHTQELVQTRVADGIAMSNWKQRQHLRYNIQGANDTDRKVIIEIPRRAGWEFDTQADTEQTPQSFRLNVQVPKGKSVRVDAEFNRTDSQELHLDELDENTLRMWSQAGLNDKLKSALPELLRLRQQEYQARQILEQAQAQLDEHIAEQQRVRENLTAVNEQSNLGQRFAEQLAKQEDNIASARAELKQNRTQWQQARQQFQDALSRL